MPKVTLEFEVTQTGASVKQVVSEASVAMAGLKQSAGGATQALAEHAGATEKAGLSYRTLNMGVRDLATAFGSTSPELTNVALGLGHVTERLSGVSTSAKLVGAGVLAAGGAVAFFFAQFQEVEKINARFAALDRTVASLDVSALRTGIQGVSVEMETLQRSGQSAAGLLVQGFSNLTRWLFGLPNAAHEAATALEYLRGAMGRAVEIQTVVDVAAHGGEMAGLQSTQIQAYLQSQIRQGTATPGFAEAWKDQLRDDLSSQIFAAKTVAWGQVQQALREAESRGTRDIEEPAITAKYNQVLEQIDAKGTNSAYGIEANVYQLEQGARGNAEATRAQGASLAIATQNAAVELAKAQAAASTKLQATNQTFEKSIGVPAWMTMTVDPNAINLINQEKTARLMAIDETTKKNLFAIDQLKTSDEARATLVGQANAAADLERTNANNEALLKTNDLYDSTAKVRNELLAASLVAKTDLVGGLDAAAAAAAAIKVGAEPASIAGDVGKIGSLSQPSPYGKEPETGPGSAAWWSGGAWGNNAWSTASGGAGAAWNALPSVPVPATLGNLQGYVSNPWSNMMNAVSVESRYDAPPGGGDSGGDVPQYQEGGVVPGPLGRPVRAIVHGGEVVLNPDQQRALAPVSGPSFHFHFDAGLSVMDRQALRSVVRRVIIPEIERARG